MSFRVVGNLSFGPASPSEHETVEEALAKAMELMSYGLANVHIVDAAGRRFTPSEFVQEMNITDRTDEAD